MLGCCRDQIAPLAWREPGAMPFFVVAQKDRQEVKGSLPIPVVVVAVVVVESDQPTSNHHHPVPQIYYRHTRPRERAKIRVPPSGDKDPH